MLEAITTNSAPTIIHWTEIKNKEVEKGMSKQKCLLAFGKPVSVQNKETKRNGCTIHIFMYSLKMKLLLL